MTSPEQQGWQPQAYPPPGSGEPWPPPHRSPWEPAPPEPEPELEVDLGHVLYPEPPQQWQQPAPPPAPKRAPISKRTKKIAVIAVGSTVMVAIVAAALVVAVRRAGQAPVIAPIATFTASPQDTSGSSSQDPEVKGWRVVGFGGASWDVPSDWVFTTVADDSGNNVPQAMYRKGACGSPSSFRGLIVPTNVTDQDVATGARSIIDATVNKYYGKDNPQFAVADPMFTKDGRARDYVATITINSPTACNPPKAVLHVVVAHSDTGGTFAVLILADLDVSDAPKEDILSKIALSVRADK